MADYTSSQTGDWSSSSTWNDAGVPGDGDTATISSGHTVTVDSNTTVGTGGASGTDELIVYGNLTVDTSYTLTIRRDMLVDPTASGDGNIVLNAGANLSFDGDYMLTYDGSTSVYAYLDINGTSGNRCKVEATTGNELSIAYLNSSWGDVIRIDADYCDFIRISDGSNEFIDQGMHGASVGWEFTNCFFNYCGSIRYGTGGNPAASSPFKFDNCDFRNPQNQNFIDYNSNDSFNADARYIKNCTFVGDSTPSRIYFGAEIPNGSGPFVLSGCIGEDCQVYNLGGGPVEIDFVHRFNNFTGSANDIFCDNSPGGWKIKDCVVVATRANAHIVSSSGAAPTTTPEYSRNITFGDNSSDNHFGFSRAINVERNITIGGNGIVSTSSNTGTVLVDRHTHINKSGNFDAVLIFETNNFGANSVTFRNSLMIGINQAGEEGVDGMNASAQDLAYADYNCFYNVNDHYDNITVANDTLTEGDDTGFGANDITDNPQLSNENATLATWDTSLGGAGTVANAFAEMLKLNGYDRSGNTATFDSDYTKTALLTYLRTAFAPGNSALDGAGLSSVDIGAEDYAPGVTSLTVQSLAHSQTVNNAVISQIHNLLINALTQAQTIENVTPTQLHSLFVASLAHAQAIDSAVLTQLYSLLIDSLAHGQTLDSATLTQLHNLSVNAMSHGQTIGATILGQIHVLLVNALAHSQTLDNIEVSAAGITALVVNALTHAQTINNTDLSQIHNLAIEALSHAQTLDNLFLGALVELVVDALTHAQTIDNVDIGQFHVLVVDSLGHSQVIDNLSLSQIHALVVESLTHSQSIESLSISGALGQAIGKVTIEIDLVKSTMSLSALKPGSEAEVV